MRTVKKYVEEGNRFPSKKNKNIFMIPGSFFSSKFVDLDLSTRQTFVHFISRYATQICNQFVKSADL